MASLADIRARLAAQDNKRNKSFTDGEGPVYPHWNINEGDTAIIRFLNDGNDANPYFWVERKMFKFPFNGIKGDPTASSNIIVQVPCMEMYPNAGKDPVLEEVRTWFKDDSLEEMGRKYWMKRTFLYQGFVRSDPMNAAAPENPIRRFMISPQIHNLIKTSLMDPEIKDLPTDALKGLDFRIQKQSKGGYADYTSSSWSRNETALSEEDHAAIAANGLSNLADFLPPMPTEEVLKVIREMFEASVEGEPYDPARWGAYFTPPGMAKTGQDKTDTSSAATDSRPGTGPAAEPVAQAEAAPTTTAQPSTQETVTPAVETAPVVAEAVVEDAPFVADTPAQASTTTEAAEPVAQADAAPAEPVVETPAANSQKAQDILKMIRSRQ